MMIGNRLAFLIAFLFLLTNLNCQRDADGKKPLKSINLNGSIKYRSINLSQIADSVSYIKLGKSSDVTLSNSLDVDFSENYILVKDDLTRNLYLFTKSGDFRRSLSSKGLKDNEYSFLSDAAIDEANNLIFLLDSRRKKILLFNLDGAYLKSLDIENRPLKIMVLNNKKILLFTPTIGKEHAKYPHVYILDYSGKVHFKVDLVEPFKKQDFYSRFCIYKYKNKMKFWQTSINKIFSIQDTGKLYTDYIISGENLVPNEYAVTGKTSARNLDNFLQIRSVIETESKLYFYVVLQQRRDIIIYDKNENFFYKLRGGKKAILGFDNDIDYGIAFLPQNQADESHLYAVLPSEFFLSEFEKIKKHSIRESNNRHQIFIEFSNTVREDDNPILQIVKIK
ncbi:6-bladed beta-propeller [Pedobacter hiemivivus]|uniref:6-bladed beta-propeller n=1 Tax=Pedobacter hiemivivus TaxID=2530454 RepID=A0A4R0NCV9_9SPHI|nr:6-bladed beta-propeller [Pedobacter hiemivivus]TCC96284.1 6-bladed beta-propeller [Pedobacter hiemivivus]